MPIQIARQLHVRMAELLHHKEYAHTFCQQNAGERVPTILHPNFPHTGFFKQRVEFNSRHVRVNRVSSLVTEHKLGLFWAKLASPAFFLAVNPQRFGQVGTHIDQPCPVGLRRTPFPVREISTNVDLLRLPVNIFNAQSESLTEPHACLKQRQEERIVRRILRNVQKSIPFGFRQSLGLLFGNEVIADGLAEIMSRVAHSRLFLKTRAPEAR